MFKAGVLCLKPDWCIFKCGLNLIQVGAVHFYPTLQSQGEWRQASEVEKSVSGSVFQNKPPGNKCVDVYTTVYQTICKKINSILVIYSTLKTCTHRYPSVFFRRRDTRAFTLKINRLCSGVFAGSFTRGVKRADVMFHRSYTVVCDTWCKEHSVRRSNRSPSWKFHVIESDPCWVPAFTAHSRIDLLLFFSGMRATGRCAH